MSPRDEILKRIDERKGEWLRLLSDLVQQPSENPPGDTRQAGACTAGFLRSGGHTSEIVAPQESMANVVAICDIDDYLDTVRVHALSALAFLST